MRSIALVSLAVLVLSTACATPAREVAPDREAAHPERSPVLPEHAWLERFVGEWRSEAEMPGEAGAPPQKLEGTERARSLGGMWIVSEIHGESPAGAMDAVLTLGFDPERKRYVGTWVDSMINHMWIYEGTVDASGRILTLESKGPSFAGDGRLATYRDVFEFESPDRKVLRSSVLGADGEWTQYLTASYQRVK
jgi:hypothetical protein